MKHLTAKSGVFFCPKKVWLAAELGSEFW